MPVGHRFEPGETRTYLAETKHVVSWESAGDTLAYETSISMELSCYTKAVGTEEVELVWRVLDLKARYRGPGVESKVDSVAQIGDDDPLLGDLMVYHLVPLTLRVNPNNGAVLGVSGTEELLKRFNQRHPPSNPTSPPPRADIAQKSFDPLRIATLFGRYLSVPGSGDGGLNLGPGVAGNATMTWEGTSYKLGLPEDESQHPRMILHSKPLPVEIRISALEGGGSSNFTSQGVLNKADGAYTMTLAGDALTQEVEQQHAVTWQLALLGRSEGSSETP